MGLRMRDDLQLNTLPEDILPLIFNFLGKGEMEKLFVINKTFNQRVLNYLRQTKLLLEFQPGELCWVVAGGTALRLHDETLRTFTQTDIREEQIKIQKDKNIKSCAIFKEKKLAEACADDMQHWYERGTARPAFALEGKLVRIVFECKVALEHPLRLYVAWLGCMVKTLSIDLQAQLKSLDYEQRNKILSAHGITMKDHFMFTKDPLPWAFAKKSSITFLGRGYPYTNATGPLEVRNDENGCC